MRLPSIAIASCFALSLLAAEPANAQSSYTLTDLGVIAGAYYVYPKDIDDTSGVTRITGSTNDKNVNVFHGWYWDSATRTMTDIGTIAGGASSSPKDVNSLGEVVGTSNNRAFYWIPSRGAKNLMELPMPSGFDPSTMSSAANKITEAGVIIGSLYSASTGGIPVYWKRDLTTGGFSCAVLPGLDGTLWGNDRGAADVNERGDICGYVSSATTFNQSRAVIWFNQGTAADPVYLEAWDAGLPDASVWPGSDFSSITENGIASGGYTDAAGLYHRFLLDVYTPGAAIDVYNVGGVTSLGETGVTTGWTFEFDGGKRRGFLKRYLGGSANIGILNTLSNAISTSAWVNASEAVVGSATYDRSGIPHAIRWTAAGGMVDLNNLAPLKNSSFQRLQGADRITDSGKIVGGGIIKGGYSRAYLLVPNP